MAKQAQSIWYWLVLIVCVSLTIMSLTLAYNKAHPSRISIRNPIVVKSVQAEKVSISLGDPFVATIEFEKTRLDCVEGRVVSHMWNRDNGRVYLVSDRPTVRHEVTGSAKIAIAFPTIPLRRQDEHLMGPGVWSIKTLLTYKCPTDSGTIVTRETVYSTPLFRVES